MAQDGEDHIQEELTDSPLLPLPLQAAPQSANYSTVPSGQHGYQQRSRLYPPNNGLLPPIQEGDPDEKITPSPKEYHAESRRNESLHHEDTSHINEQPADETNIHPALREQVVRGQYPDLPQRSYSMIQPGQSRQVDQLPPRLQQNSSQPRSSVPKELDTRCTPSAPLQVGVQSLPLAKVLHQPYLDDWTASKLNRAQRGTLVGLFERQPQSTASTTPIEDVTTAVKSRGLDEIGRHVYKVREAPTLFENANKRFKETFERERAGQPDLYRIMGKEDFERYVRQKVQEETSHPKADGLEQQPSYNQYNTTSFQVQAIPEVEVARQNMSSLDQSNQGHANGMTLPSSSQPDLQEIPKRSNRSWISRSFGRASKGIRGFAKFHGAKDDTKPHKKTIDELVEDHRMYLNGLSKKSVFNNFATQAELQMIMIYERNRRANFESAAPEAQHGP